MRTVRHLLTPALAVLGALAAFAVGAAPAGATAVALHVETCGLFDDRVVAVDQSVLQAGERAKLTLPTPCLINLDVHKSVSNPTPNLNDPISWTIKVHNGSGVTAPGVVVLDVFTPPMGTDFAYSSSVASTGFFSPGTGVWAIGPLGPNATATLVISGFVIGAHTETNCATAASYAPPLLFNAAIPEVETATRLAHFSIGKDDDHLVGFAKDCASETPVTTTPTPTPTGSPGATPTPTITTSTTGSGSVGLPASGHPAAA